ncbi:hypothetical protein NEF87_002438 [Candidatus Lokiarchaeum ossiferum]|uniref:Uncharacterized protein n=1 Tax=Candidatus Lokiarchaeum ossiferum TaxID=2951803 RepID=A0ABY6HRL9_9ARCH|nr:hypothetical protein NEF87_002438 [Candidatus Lokiarchaeum sp. B-35]
MGITIISENNSLEKTIIDGLRLLEQKGGFIPSKGKVLIVVDMLIPQPFPVSFNPDSLVVLINFLKSRGISEIYVLPVVFNGYSSDALLSNYGLKTWINHHNAILVDRSDVFDQKISQNLDGETDPTLEPSEVINEPNLSLFSQIDSIVLLSQLKQDPLFGFWASLPLFSVFSNSNTSKSPETYQEWIDRPSQSLSKEKPLLFINDGFSIIEQNGPCIGKRIKTTHLHRVYFGNDCLTLDWETLIDLGFDPKQNPFLKQINEEKFASSGNNVVKTPENIAKLDIKPIPKDLNLFKLPGLSLHLGNLSVADHHTLYLLLLRFQTILFKDLYNVGDWILLAGENPPEPNFTGKEYIVVFGNSAIQSTQDYAFRSILKSSLKEPLEILGFETGVTRILDGDELERAIIGKQAKLRRKNELFQSKIDHQISMIEEKEQTPSLKLLKLKKKKKLEKSTISFHYKLERIRLDLSYKHEKLRIQNKAPDVVLNSKVVELSNYQPIGLQNMLTIANFIPSKMIPTLTTFLDSMKTVYNFIEFDKKERTIQQKQQRSKLKAKITEINRPILPQIKSELKLAKQTYKEQIQKYKQNRKNALEELKPKFQPQIDNLKIEKKNYSKQKSLRSESVLLPESVSKDTQEEKPEGEKSNE